MNMSMPVSLPPLPGSPLPCTHREELGVGWPRSLPHGTCCLLDCERARRDGLLRQTAEDARVNRTVELGEAEKCGLDGGVQACVWHLGRGGDGGTGGRGGGALRIARIALSRGVVG